MSLAPEIAKTYPIIGQPHPFSVDAVYAQIPAGHTLAQALGENISRAVKVEVGGREVPRKLWAHLRPKPGVPVYITAFPQGGDTGKKILRVVLLIVIAVIAWYAAPYIAGAMGYAAGTTAFTIATGVISSVITMVGGLLVNALVPPPKPGAPKDTGGDATDRLHSLTGSQNAANPGGVIPIVIGEAKFYPPHAALPYTELLGNDQFLYMMLDLGFGDLVVSDIEIGGTLISQFEDVEYEVSTDPDLFSNDIYELQVGVPINAQNDTVTRTSQVNADELSVDIVFPQGLFGVDAKGNTITVTTDVMVEYRLTGSIDPWVQVPTQGINSPTTVRTSSMRFLNVNLPAQVKSAGRNPIRTGVAWKVTPGQYDVRVTRGATNWGASQENARVGQCSVTVMRTIKYVKPSRTGTTKLALRIRATDQLQGVISNLTVLVQQKVPVWDAGLQVWSAPQVNFNPAYIYRWLLTSCPATAKLVPFSRVDDEFIIDFGQQCIDKSFQVRGVADSVTTFQELLSQVLSAGRGTLGWRDGRYSVVWDRPQTVPRQHFTPLNSSGFGAQRVFSDLPHAFYVKFINPAAGWQEDQIVVPMPGYAYDDGSGPKDAHGVAAPTLPLATKFETLQFRFVTSPLHAWYLTRYHQAQGLYRPTAYSWKTDIEHLSCTRGDMVYVASDVTEWGDGWGRVKAQTLNGLNEVTSLTLDQAVVFEVGLSYSIRVRKQSGESAIVGIVNPEAETDTITMSGVLSGVNKGDLVIVGETTNVMRELLVTGVIPEGNLTATMTGVLNAPEVYTFDANPPAQFLSAITGLPFVESPDPPKLDLIFSSDATNRTDDGGGTDPTVNVAVDPGSPYHPWTRIHLQQF